MNTNDLFLRALLQVPKTIVFASSALKVNKSYQIQRNRLMGGDAAFIERESRDHRHCTISRLHAKTEVGVQEHVTSAFCGKGGHCRVCFATAVMEHGIDCCDVDRVVHLGCPTSPESMVQRTGRAGRRAETFVYSILFYNGQDFRDRDGKSFNTDMIRYCENTTECRYKLLRSFFI
jgi:superfamily II DNA/RNA helicase